LFIGQKNLLLAKQTQAHTQRTCGAVIKVTQKVHEKNEMLPTTFVGSCRCAWNRSIRHPDFTTRLFSDNCPIFVAHHDCLPKMAKFGYKNNCQPVAGY